MNVIYLFFIYLMMFSIAKIISLQMKEWITFTSHALHYCIKARVVQLAKQYTFQY
jgi:hypothetical protein